MPSSTPIALVNALDVLQRDSLLASIAFGSHNCVVLSHDIDPEQGLLFRVISDSTGVIERETIPLEHACSGCALREDALPVLEWLVSLQRWDAIMYAPPLGTDPLVAATGIAGGERPGKSVIPGAHLARVATIVNAATLREDILGDAILADLGEPCFQHDDRSVGEALSSMVEFSDLVVLETPLEMEEAAAAAALASAREFLSHVVDEDVPLVEGSMQLSDCDVLDYSHDPREGLRRRDPERLRAHTTRTESLWTVALETERPFHPERLVEFVEDLGTGRLRARGCFWVPTRPSSICQWEGAGGQVSIGEVARVLDDPMAEPSAHTPVTRLVITGDVPADRDRVVNAFNRIVLSDIEWESGLVAWLGRADGLDPWLGERGVEAA